MMRLIPVDMQVCEFSFADFQIGEPLAVSSPIPSA